MKQEVANRLTSGGARNLLLGILSERSGRQGRGDEREAASRAAERMGPAEGWT